MDKLKAVKDEKIVLSPLDKWIEKSLPKDAQSSGKTEIKACAEGVTEKLTKDDNCKSYEKLVNCAVGAFTKVIFIFSIFSHTHSKIFISFADLQQLTNLTRSIKLYDPIVAQNLK